MDLAAAAEAKLASSGITLEQAAYAKISTLTDKQTAKLYHGAPSAPSLRISYLDPLGKSTEFYRLRLLAPPPGFAGQATKAQRYVQPPGTTPRVYFPRTAKFNWVDLVTDPEVPLIITEGEFKALSATLQGFPTLGLGGVWNFRSKNEGTFFIEELRAIEWEGRIVYVCYDSDANTKPDVVRAALALAEELGERGAEVYDSGMPPIGDGKVGLDDFLVARGAGALKKHLERAEPFGEINDLHRFNERFLYVKGLDSVVELESRAMYAANAFRSTVAANEKYERRKINGKGEIVMEKRSLAKDWMEWPRRAQAETVDYAPGSERLLYPGPRYNLWRGWGVEPKKGDVKLWKELLEFVFQSEPEQIPWIEKWFAYPLQHPGTKLYTAVAVWGTGQGTGKTLLGEHVMLIYGDNGQLVEHQHLQSSYSSWLDNRCFILGDEITGNESRQHADRLKGLITSNTITINKKYVPEYVLPNRVNFYFTSNHPDAFFLDPQDRRFFVIQAPNFAMPDSFYQRYDDWMRRGGGLGALFHYLLNVDTSDFNPRAAAPQTRAKAAMIEENKSDVAAWVYQLKKNPETVLTRFNLETRRDLFNNHELLLFYDPDGSKRCSANQMGRELKKAGFSKVYHDQPIKTDHGSHRYYAVRNEAKWVKEKDLQKIMAHINAHPLSDGSKY